MFFLDSRQITWRMSLVSAQEAVPMRVVTRLTGLSADTLRAWERRHRAIEPARTAGKARRYSEAQIRRLVLLRAATGNGHAIGDVAALSDSALAALGDVAPKRASSMLDAYLDALGRFDPIATGSLLDALARDVSATQLVLDRLVPLMREVGMRWHDGATSIAQEHLATTQVRRLVERELAAVRIDPGAPSIVLAAPERHLHDLGLLFGALLAAHRGVRPIVLGANLPIAELGPAIRRAQASIVVVACARDLDREERRTLPRALATLASRHELWIGVPSGHALGAVRGAHVFTSFAAFDTALAARWP